MNKIFTTVCTIFKERYGAELIFEEGFQLKTQKPHFNSRWPSSFVYSRTRRQVSFPIFNSRRELQAIATASPVDNQDAVVFDEMAQFLQLTVAEHIELSAQLQDKKRLEVAIEKSHADSSKVVDLKTRKPVPGAQIQFKKRKMDREPDLRPIWIQGEDENINAHIAFSIHEWASNWAFINAAEIPDLIWEDTTGWSNFPDITIFIPNISELDPQRVETLKDNIESLQKLTGSKALIIVTSKEEPTEENRELARFFKHYKANKGVKPQVQAHFLLFHHQDKKIWQHHCEQTNGLFFLPFSPTPNKLH